MNRERLKMLEDLMRRVQVAPDPGRAFHMDYWFLTAFSRCEDTLGRKDCGTSACALGYAALQPEFQALGLSPSPSGSAPAYHPPGSGYGARRTGMEAAEAFFDIDPNIACYLFNGNDAYGEELEYREVQPIDVANRIARLLQETPE